ncbi:zf-CCHC domain-containing protein [Gossypium australe]|uniref:Zf-CCHC domain-containing protein n=1 Tax=Gossypium australe TaxID=47621 RepID=A0A5B6X359_9ROSI|nr:zf-CCHC domain-containing protein [Gossypium australe]
MDGPSIPLKQEGELLIPKKEYSRESYCSNAKEIWDKLEVTHECTNQVKKSKFFATHEMRLNKGVEAKIEKKKVVVSLKSTTNEDSESSKELDEDKEMVMFAGRFKSDEDSSDENDQEVANLCLMTIDDSKVTPNSSSSISYSFDKLQDVYDELGLEFEVMVSKYKKNISKLKNENDLLSKTNHELEEKVNKM